MSLLGADREVERLRVLHRYNVLDTEPEAVFDELVAAAAAMAEVPTAIVGLIDADRQWYKARVGIDICEVSRDVTFCDHVVRDDAELVVPDATKDPRFCDNPFVVGDGGVRFYAGIPLRSPEGMVLGTLCVIDYVPRTLSPPQMVALRALAGQVMSQLDLRVALAREREARQELRATAETAQRSEAMLSGLLEGAPVAVIACDADGHLTMFNRAAKRFHDADADILLSPQEWAPHYGLYRADGTTLLAADEVPLARALAGEVVADELIIIDSGHSPARSVACDGRQLFDLDGNVAGAVVAMVDVTTRVLLERELRTSEESMRSALDALPRQITLLDVVRDDEGEPTELRVTWTNARVRDVSGLDLSGLVGRKLREVFPSVTTELEEAYLGVARGGAPYSRQVDWFDGDHLHGAVELTVVPWSADGLLLDVQNVTARREAELALAASQRRLEMAQELAGIATWGWDLVACKAVWSRRLYELFDTPQTQPPSFDYMIYMVHPEERPDFCAAYGRLLSEGESISLDHRIRLANGSERWVRSWGVAERDPQGRIVRIDGSVQEITEHRNREAAALHAAAVDPLTDLVNRRGWEATTGAIIDRCRRRGEPVGVAIVDIDHFKRVNDNHGHEAGDRLLRDCAVAWRTVLRDGDVLGRLGGEEFGVLLPGCDRLAADGLLERLRQATPTPTTISVGITQLDIAETLGDALARADEALYAAKAGGRDRIVRA